MGFEFSEVMAGTYALADAPAEQHRMSFDIRTSAPSTLQHLRSGGQALIEGVLEMDGFADAVPITGMMTLAPLTKRVIRYEFAFTANDSKPYRFVGQKDIKLTTLRRSFTTLPGEILDPSGRVVATSLTRFDLRSDWFQFVTSWRPA